MRKFVIIVSTMIILIFFVTSTIKAIAAQTESTVQPMDDVGDTITPPGSDGAYIMLDEYNIDFETGVGSAQCVLNTHYYDAEHAIGHLPAITVGMGTTVTADMWAYVWARDTYGYQTVLDSSIGQSTSFYAIAKNSFIQAEWEYYEANLGACDDEGNGTFYLIDHYEGYGYPDNYDLGVE